MTVSASHKTNWNALLEDIISGVWKDPATGKSAIIPFETILIEDSLDGREADLVAHLRLGTRLAVVSDTNTFEAMGRRIGQALKKIATIDEIVLPSDISCDEPTIANIQDLTRHADGVVAVGSGVLSDSCKYATFKDGRPFAVFGTAASMNGYAASTASVTLSNGFKVSLPAHAPRGIFLDLAVTAASPTYLGASGLGDSLCRPTAQVDWWTSHRLFGTLYSDTPYLLQRADEAAMLATAKGLASGDRNAAGHLQRVLTLCGLGVCFTGVSNHGSMGEHQVSHWVDMFAGAAHPGSTHGQQVGVASLAIARLQHRILSMETPPEIGPTRIDELRMMRRYGSEIGPMCIAEASKKAMNAVQARAFNRRLASIWPTLRSELAPMLLPVETMTSALMVAKGPIDADTLGLPRPVWRDALKYAREIRNRWSFLDLADDAGLLDDFLDEERL
ncbi:MAG: iron-containing alcohol dehydrogenase [Beijerinckiaceae bacterium]|nr:iron-containing alcohol dehydrogenase [Beijerinckiaceae bacterium]